MRGVVTVLLPGTGSDDDYLRRVFAGPLERAEATLIAVQPDPDNLLAGYLDALESAAADGPIAVGGVSIGAAVAACWALAHPDRTIAVLAVLPPWTGAPADAPAALSARHTAAMLRRDGLESRGQAWSVEDEAAFKAPVRERYETEGDPYYATARLWDDGIIDPAQTRDVLGLAISASLNAPIPETRFGVFRM